MPGPQLSLVLALFGQTGASSLNPVVTGCRLQGASIHVTTVLRGILRLTLLTICRTSQGVWDCLTSV